MTLGFQQAFADGSPTHFKEKILGDEGFLPKLHTIRIDNSDRWRADCAIQMVYGNRTKNRVQFNSDRPDLSKCISTQSFKIVWKKHNYKIFVDDRQLSTQEAEVLAVNDGFNNLIHFLSFFNKDMSGKIIHWTNKRY